MSAAPSSGRGRADGDQGGDGLLTVVEAADFLRVSERFVRGLIAAGDLPAAKIGARVLRVRRADVVALLRPVDVPKSPR